MSFLSPRYDDKFTMTTLATTRGDTGVGDPGQWDGGIYAAGLACQASTQRGPPVYYIGDEGVQGAGTDTPGEDVPGR